jgi:hypothetical protein
LDGGFAFCGGGFGEGHQQHSGVVVAGLVAAVAVGVVLPDVFVSGGVFFQLNNLH